MFPLTVLFFCTRSLGYMCVVLFRVIHCSVVAVSPVTLPSLIMLVERKGEIFSKLNYVSETILSISLCRAGCLARRKGDAQRYAASVTFRNRTLE